MQKSSPQGDILALYSRYPIIGRERIKFDSRYNLSEAYVLNINGQKVLLVNNPTTSRERGGCRRRDKTDSADLYMARSAGKEQESYVATGNGPGWSYHKSSIHVRIDNILCSSEWKPYAAKVDNTCPYSDHYPIICWLTPRGKR